MERYTFDLQNQPNCSLWWLVNPVNYGVKISTTDHGQLCVCVCKGHTQLASSVIEHSWLKPAFDF